MRTVANVADFGAANLNIWLTIELMRVGQDARPTLASVHTRSDIEHDYRHLSENQRAAVDQILASRDHSKATGNACRVSRCITASITTYAPHSAKPAPVIPSGGMSRASRTIKTSSATFLKRRKTFFNNA